ncbi:MAG: ABC transporter permease [Flavobacteriales bacterium]
MNKILLIIKREFWTRVRKPSFLIMTLLGPLLLVGGIALIAFIGMQESGPQSVLVVDDAHLFTGKLTNSEGLGVTFHYTYDDLPDSLFKGGPYTLKVYLNPKIIENDVVQIFYKDPPSQTVERYITNDIQNVLRKAKLKKDSLDEATFDRITTALKVDTFDIDKSGEKSFDRAKAAVGFGFGYIMFFFVFLYGVQVMRGVMEEKQSRVVEVLISSVKPFQLMMGKIVGIAMVGLTQFLLWAILSAVLTVVGISIMGLSLDGDALAQVQKTTEMQQQLGDAGGAAVLQDNGASEMTEMYNAFRAMPWGAILALFVFYFLGGYLLYSSLFAAVGSAVDSETDSQQFMMPITIPLMIAVFVAQMAVVNPSSPAVFWCSIIPFTSPIVMMIRIAMGDAFEHPAQLVLSMTMLVGAFIFTTWLAGRIYRTGILMYGKKVSWRELGKWLFYRG